MSAERQPTPNAVAPLYRNLTYESKDAYVDVKISNKDIVLARSNEAALIDTVQDALDASYDAAKWNVGRMLFGDGTGILARLTANATTASTQITVDDTSKLIEGLVIDLYAANGTAPSATTLQIISIDYQNNTVELSSAPQANVATGGFLVVQNSYKREITGLGKIFAPASTTQTDIGYEIYGVPKATNAWVNPFVVDAQNDISDVVITDAIRLSTRRNGRVDLIMAGGDAYNAYEYYMRETGINTNIVEKRKFISGAAGYDIMFGDRIATLVRNDFVPADEMWGVDTKQFTLRQTGWNFVTHKSSDIFNLMEDTSVFRALLADYMELVCKNPGTCVRIINANAE